MSLNPVRPQRVGNLRDRIVWQEKVGETWEDRETEPARVEPLKGREQFEASVSQRYATADYRVYCRYRYVPNTAVWRVLWLTGHQRPNDAVPPVMVPERLILDIEAVLNPDERRRYIELTVTNTASASFPPVPDPEPQPDPDGSYRITAGEDSTYRGFVMGDIGTINAEPIAGATLYSTVSVRSTPGAGKIEIVGDRGALEPLLEDKGVYIDNVLIGDETHWTFDTYMATWEVSSGFPAFDLDAEYLIVFEEA